MWKFNLKLVFSLLFEIQYDAFVAVVLLSGFPVKVTVSPLFDHFFTITS